MTPVTSFTMTGQMWWLTLFEGCLGKLKHMLLAHRLILTLDWFGILPTACDLRLGTHTPLYARQDTQYPRTAVRLCKRAIRILGTLDLIPCPLLTIMVSRGPALVGAVLPSVVRLR